MLRRKIICTLVLLSTALFLSGDRPFARAENESKRVRFHIKTIGQTVEGSGSLAETTVEGQPGTDFNINLKTERFRMETRFLSDLTIDQKLQIRAGLNTRRFYGTSPAGLPLYEEDAQKRTLSVGSGETLVLLPFGQNGLTDETLKIEITPEILTVSPNEAAEPLKINFDKPLPGGEISIEAFKIPHRFAVEAVLSADGKTIARGAGDLLIEEEKEIELFPTGETGEKPTAFKANLTVDKFLRSVPTDSVGINFSFFRRPQDAGFQPVIAGGAGIGPLGGEIVYRLDQTDFPDGKNYELKFRVRLADGEKANN
ncbi:MAG: hypothetical protein R2747_22035 [Pyrinomonadaceae bacterium]